MPVLPLPSGPRSPAPLSPLACWPVAMGCLPRPSARGASAVRLIAETAPAALISSLGKQPRRSGPLSVRYAARPAFLWMISPLWSPPFFLKGRSAEMLGRECLDAAPARANCSHDPPFDPCTLPKALHVIAHTKDVSHPDK